MKDAMFRRVRVEGRSMLPTLQPGQVLWSNRWIYRFRAPRKGEIVLVDHPSRPLRLIKRVVGVPGETIDGRGLGKDEYFVLGDNPAESTGSESFGVMTRRRIIGRVRDFS